MAEYNNPLSGFLGGFSAPIIAREKEDRLLKNQLGLIGLQNDLATQTAAATREFETINQTILSYSSRRDKLTEERNKMIRSAYAPPGSSNIMPLSTAQSNARIREMGFEPGYFKQIVQQMDDQIGKLGQGIDQMMVYKTNKYGPSGVSFKHISSIGGLPRQVGGGGAGSAGAQTGVDVSGHSPPNPSQGPLSGFVGSVIDTVEPAASAVGATVSNLWKTYQQERDEAKKEGWFSYAPFLSKVISSLAKGIAEPNIVSDVYEDFSRFLGVNPEDTVAFWASEGTVSEKVLAAFTQLGDDFFKALNSVDNILIAKDIVPPGWVRNNEGKIVPTGIRKKMIDGQIGSGSGTSSAQQAITGVPSVVGGDPFTGEDNLGATVTAIPTSGSWSDGEPSTSKGTELRYTPFDNVPNYDPLGRDVDENIIGSPTGRFLNENIGDSASSTRDRFIDSELSAGRLPLVPSNYSSQGRPHQLDALEPGGMPSIPIETDYLGQQDVGTYSGPPGILEGSQGIIEGTNQTQLIQQLNADEPTLNAGGYTGPRGDTTPVNTSSEDTVPVVESLPTQTVVQQANQVLSAIESGALGAEEGEDYWTAGRGVSAVAGASAIIAIEVGKRKFGNTELERKGESISGGASTKAMKALKTTINELDKQIKAQQTTLKRALKNPDYGNPDILKRELADMEGKANAAKVSYRNHVVNRRWRAGGRVGQFLGLLLMGVGQVYAGIAGEEAANDFMYEFVEGNPEVISLAVKIAERTKTPYDLLIEEIQKDKPFQAIEFQNSLQNPRTIGSESKNIMDATLPSVDVGQGDYYGRDADRESLGMKGWHRQQARELKRTETPRTSIKKRSDTQSPDESADTFDDLINWVTSLGSSVVPEAAANADVPIESIGLAREVPEMVLNNPRIGFGPKISFTESKGLYDAVGYNTVTKEARPPDPMVNTGKWADVRAKYGDSLGIGKYQFTNGFLVDIYADTLNSSKKDAQIFLDNKVFKDSMQEQALALAFGYLGLEDVIRGKMSAKRFVDKIEGRWHGIAKAIEEDPNYKQVMIDDLEGMVEQATGRTFSFSKSN
jgi:vacuolar-type H+-ATPase subunit F/Vma7